MSIKKPESTFCSCSADYVSLVPGFKVIGNRSSCLSHASLIVPWSAQICQLQPALLQKTRDQGAAARGIGLT